MNNEKFKIICNFHGYSDAFIAKELGICERAVRNYSSGKTKKNESLINLALTLDALARREFDNFIKNLIETKILKKMPIFKSSKIFEKYKFHLFSQKKEIEELLALAKETAIKREVLTRAKNTVSLKNEGYLNLIKINDVYAYLSFGYRFFDEKKYLSFLKKEKLKVNRDSLIKFINSQ